ncbi:rhodanese-like domain-containing protein [Aeoliella sp. ICT_H6.2]|uniref:Rhodanese-like domain-containing protein n=1 Tax=Aeoliella straminimaris TaxID=2954799 RepID=A0A9X2F689_9BACT|nr:rhodanese-like domain-containing protein [Aeoliella straminimaris]MCO6042990.1 rhodanese-like domain-containing protein [Aeoliella straminimaris]
MAAQTISPNEFKSVVDGGNFKLVDVRTPAEFQSTHVRGAVNVPLDQVSPDSVPQPVEGKPLYIICQKGGRGSQACDQLTAAGLENVVNVEGGTTACEQAGLPLVHGKKTMSLERQVRIAAGSLVLLGIGLYFVHPAFLALSAFVGAGLVFAGVTDTCGMGMLLARMPWNQACGDGSCSTKAAKAA